MSGSRGRSSGVLRGSRPRNVQSSLLGGVPTPGGRHVRPSVRLVGGVNARHTRHVSWGEGNKGRQARHTWVQVYGHTGAQVDRCTGIQVHR